MGRTEFGDPLCGSTDAAQRSQRGNACHQVEQP